MYSINAVAHVKTKHVDIHYHSISESIQSEMINFTISPHGMSTDLLTKPLMKEQLVKLCLALRMETFPTIQSTNYVGVFREYVIGRLASSDQLSCE